MDRLDAQHNSEIILEALSTYLTDFDREYHDPDVTVTRLQCQRANYIQGLINIMKGREKNTTSGLPSRKDQKQLNHKMISVSLECLMHYRKSLNDNARKRYALGAIEQQNHMYNERIVKRQLDNTFWALSKPFMASLPDTQIAEAKRLSSRFSPMEVIQIILARNDELTDDDVEEDILEDAHEMNSGSNGRLRFKKRPHAPRKRHRSFLGWLRHKHADTELERKARIAKKIRRHQKTIDELLKNYDREDDK